MLTRYIKTKELAVPNDMKLGRVTFIRPSGNDTAIIWDQIDPNQYASVASVIQQEFPNIEQVMFAERDPDTNMVRGQMTGGEFCANASRAFAYLLAEGKDGSMKVNVSGSPYPFMATIADQNAAIQIPLMKAKELLIMTSDNGDISVDMGGIIHSLCFEGDQQFKRIQSCASIEEKKYYLRKLFSTEMYQKYPACGMMLVTSKNDSDMEINPFVYVRDTGTIYNETACASGSAAVAIICALEQGQSIENLRILQPSGLYITASVAYENGFFETVNVGGDIDVIYDGELSIPITSQEVQNAS